MEERLRAALPNLYEQCAWVSQMPERPLCSLCWVRQNWVHDNNIETRFVETWLVESHHPECPRVEHDGERHLILNRPPGTAIAP